MPPVSFLVAIEVAIWLAGVALLWAVIAGRLRAHASALPRWTVSLETFIVAALLVIGGGWMLPHLPARLSHDILGPAAYDGDWWMVVQGASFQLGLLGGALMAALYLRVRGRLELRATPVEPAPPELPPPSARSSRPLITGCVVFLISIPVINCVGLVWKTVLDLAGLPTHEQEMIEAFRNADDPTLLALMIALAALLAPITEEVIFRGGLFRYLHTRVSRTFALVLPALIFALLHGNIVAFVPLFALGVFFALAYERTGRIAVPIIAHALFNLHTIALALHGVV